MRLPEQRKILREDIKTKDSWVSAIIGPINSFMDTIYIAMNKNITFSENIRCMVKDLSVVTASDYPNMEPIEFPNTMGVKASGLIVIQAYNKTGFFPVTSPVYAAWSDDSGTIKITFISGLAASESYSVKVLVI